MRGNDPQSSERLSSRTRLRVVALILLAVVLCCSPELWWRYRKWQLLQALGPLSSNVAILESSVIVGGNDDAVIRTLHVLNEHWHVSHLILNGGDKVTDSTAVVLPKLDPLRILSVRGAAITDKGLREISKLPQLESLDVQACMGITDAGIAELVEAKSLETLYVEATSISRKSLEELIRKNPRLQNTAMQYELAKLN